MSPPPHARLSETKRGSRRMTTQQTSLDANSATSRPGGIVITGMGLITALGLDCATTWRRVREGASGIGQLTALEQQPKEPKGGGQVPDLPDDQRDRGEPREVAYLRRAIAEALRNAGAASALPYPAHRCGIILGTTLHGMRAAGNHFRQQDAAPLRDFQAAAVLERAATEVGIENIAATTCAACSSGLSSIGLAATLLQSGELDLVIAGGYDTISEYAYGGFNALRLVADGPIRPFCRDRQGMKLGEGYGILILERAADARARRTTQAWPILGVGETADAHHLTQPHPEGDGAARAITQALQQADLNPADIGLICAHATGTPDNDRGEAAALARTFADRLPHTPVAALKSLLGHTLGGAGAVELILAIHALNDQCVPPTLSASADEIEYPDVRLAAQAHPAQIDAVMNLSIGFGGANTCVIVGKPQRHAATANVSAAPRPLRDVCVTGIGVVFPGAIGNEAFANRLTDATAPMLSEAPPPIDQNEIIDLLQTRRVRRMSDYVKLSLAATRLACDDARLTDPDLLANCAAILGTTHGSAAYSEEYYAQIVREGIDWANPMLFAEGVPNAGAAHLSLMLGLKGSCQTIIGSRTAGLDALRLAALRIATGQWDRAIVSTAEEATPLTASAYRHCGLHTASNQGGAPMHPRQGFVIGQGAATLVLESREAAQARGVSPKLIVEQTRTGFVAAEARRDPAPLRRMLDDLGQPDHLITSANSTWLGRMETAALNGSPRTLTSLYGHIAETFSVMPLAAIAAVALTRRLPRLHGDMHSADGKSSPGVGDEPPTRFGLLVTDPYGPIAGATCRLP